MISLILNELSTTIVMLVFLLLMLYLRKNRPGLYKLYFGAPTFAIGDWRKTLLAPALLVSITIFALVQAFSGRLIAPQVSIAHKIVQNLILGPVFEEIMFRGFLLGMVCFPIINMYKVNKTAVYIGGTLLVSLIFTWLHINTNAFQYALRFSGAVVYSFLYLWNDRNLLPPIFAHFFGNLIVLVSG